jgi:nitrogen fixation-related uncharacterized protein
MRFLTHNMGVILAIVIALAALLWTVAPALSFDPYYRPLHSTN